MSDKGTPVHTAVQGESFLVCFKMSASDKTKQCLYGVSQLHNTTIDKSDNSAVLAIRYQVRAMQVSCY